MRQRRLVILVGTVALLAASTAPAEPPAHSGPRPARSGMPGRPHGDARPGPSGQGPERGGPPGLRDRDGDKHGERGRGPGPGPGRIDRDGDDEREDAGPPGERGHRRRHFRAMWDDLHERFRAEKPDKEELKKKLEEWRAAREDRRRDHRMRLAKRWGHAVGKPDVNSELKLHAKRLAHLSRMEEVVGTEKTGDARKKLLDRIDKLRNLENERHQRAMDRLTGAPGAAGSAPPPPTPPAAAPSAGGAQ